MGQIIKNYMLILIVPFFIGLVVRFLCQRTKRAYLSTLAFIAIAIIGWVVYYAVPSHGSELYGILALIGTSVAAGALLAGLIARVKGKR